MEVVAQSFRGCGPFLHEVHRGTSASSHSSMLAPVASHSHASAGWSRKRDLLPSSALCPGNKFVEMPWTSGGLDDPNHSRNPSATDVFLLPKSGHRTTVLHALSKLSRKSRGRKVAPARPAPKASPPVVKEPPTPAIVKEPQKTSAVKEVVWHLQQGMREEMEDSISVVKNEMNGFVYAGVFDGHAGSESSNFLKDELYKECLNSLDGGKLLKSDDPALTEKAFKEAFANVDAKLLSWLENQDQDKRESGSTAVITFISDDKIFVAHVGDSRAVLSREGDSEDLSFDHRPHGGSDMSIYEIERVKNAGGWISYGRVCGALAVSRAFGDLMYKSHRKEMLMNGFKKGKFTKRFIDKLNLDNEWVISTPDVNSCSISDNCDFLLLASDGLWDSVKSSEACRFVKRQLDEHGNAQLACDNLAELALKERKGEDNLSIVLIILK